jgi:hypothetical protein
VNQFPSYEPRPNQDTIASRLSKSRPAGTTIAPVLIIGALITTLVVGPGIAPAMQAQDAATPAATDVKEVTLSVTVHDKHGKIVHDLTKDDFTLQEDGRPQIIRSFSQPTNLPLTIGLLVDTSRSQDKVLDAERNASRSFLDQMLVKPTDKAFLIHFDRQVELLQDVTSSHEKLKAALDLLEPASDREHSNDPNDPCQFPVRLRLAWQSQATL